MPAMRFHPRKRDIRGGSVVAENINRKADGTKERHNRGDDNGRDNLEDGGPQAVKGELRRTSQARRLLRRNEDSAMSTD